MDLEQLRHLTVQLLKYNNDANTYFIRAKGTGEKGDFFKEVKPFADHVKQCCDEWVPLASKWVTLTKPRQLYPLQIKNTAENIQMVSIRAFFPDTSLKRFNSHIQSIDYVLKRMLDELNSHED